MRTLQLSILTMFLIISNALAAVNLKDGLIAHYPFDGNANDVSGNNLHGWVAYGVTPTEDRFGLPNRAYSFDGLRGYITVNDHEKILNFNATTQSYSVSCWVYLRERYGTILIDRGSNQNSPSSFTLVDHFSGNRFYVGAWSSANVGVFSETVPKLGEWYHLVMVANTVEIRLFLNGVEEHDPTIYPEIKEHFPADFGSTRTEETVRNIGRSMPGNSSYFNGKIDDIRIYNRALTEDEVHALYFGEIIVVNSVSDRPDNDITDDQCWTGQFITRNGVQEPERTLRAAIETVNARHSFVPVEISFNLPDGVTPVIAIESPLPTIESPLTIDGTSQPNGGYIELNGQSMSGVFDANGLRIDTDDVTLRGITIHSFPQYGLHILGGSGHTVVGNNIGFDRTGTNLQLNESGGIKVTGDVRDCTIGALEEDKDMNYVGGGILLAGADVERIRVLKNVIEIPESEDKIPLDLSTKQDGSWDGPTVSSWSQTQTGPNGLIAPPRILSISHNKVTGIAKPLSTVIIYDVTATGSQQKRYFARRVEPITYWPSDFDGYFEIPVDLESFTELAATVTDNRGNTSELSQLRRPVIFLPGVAGSWLKDQQGGNIWPPMESIADSDEQWNERLLRLAMNEAGQDISGIQPYRVLEYFYGEDRAYGRFLESMHQLYRGHVDNANPETLDIWRLPYDWRKSPDELADQLKAFIDDISGTEVGHAWCNEVDIVAHSMGGLVASTYLRKYPEHSRNHVHRLVTIATPYLGAPQVAAGHARGYLFGLDENRVVIRPFKPNWSGILKTFRNLPAAYTLLPSRAYFKTWDYLYYLEDFEREPLWNSTETARFLTNRKGGGKAVSGLGRNSDLLTAEQNRVHDLIDDWRNWQGPPLIFRLIGRRRGSTVVRWEIERPDAHMAAKQQWAFWQSRVTRKEEGDTEGIINYRNWLKPILGYGDGTVPLESATLGKMYANAGEGNQGTDFSGVNESRWIEEFEDFPCDHLGLVSGDCQNLDGVDLDYRVLEILTSGYRVLDNFTSSSKRSGTINGWDSEQAPQEIFYLVGSSPISVVLEDGQGEYTGPVDPDSLEHIHYGLPEVGYWASEFVVTISAPSTESYTLQVDAPHDSTVVRATRLVAKELDRDHLLFENQLLRSGGQLQFSLLAGGTDLNAVLEVDADGDGSYESQVAPAAHLVSPLLAPAVPTPQPFVLRTESLKSSPTEPQVSLELPDVGVPGWQWQLSDFAGWIAPSATSGVAPASVPLTLKSSMLDEGVHEDSLIVSLSIGDYSRDVFAVVQLVLREQSAMLTRIDVDPGEATLAVEESKRFTALGFDQLDLPYSFTPVWSATGGNIDSTGLFTAGIIEAGTFMVRAASQDGSIYGEAVVTVTDVTTVEEIGSAPKDFRLFQNHPNPFNPETEIRFRIPETRDVTLKIYNLLGQEIRTLSNGTITPGEHTVRWDGWDDSGQEVASGVYLYRLRAGDFSAVRKLILIK